MNESPTTLCPKASPSTERRNWYRETPMERCISRRPSGPGFVALCRLPITNRGKRVSDYFRAGTTVYLELWSSFPTTPFVDHDRHIYLQPIIQPCGFANSGLSTC